MKVDKKERKHKPRCWYQHWKYKQWNPTCWFNNV